MRTSRLAATAALLGVLLATSVARAGDDDNLDKLTRAFLDDSAKVADREDALTKATGVTRIIQTQGHPERVEIFKGAVKDVLVGLAARRADASYAKLIELAMKGMDLFTPYPDAGTLVRPYLKGAPDEVRTQALRAIQMHGATNVQKELVQVLGEGAKRNRLRELVERSVVTCTVSIPTAEAQKVLETALKTKYRGVRLMAIMGLGDLNALRPAKEVDARSARAALIAVAQGKDEALAAAAALALLRYDSWDGIAEVVKRLEAGGTRESYRAICEAAHQPGGFLGVSPERFYEVQPKRRDDAMAEIKLWWSKVKNSQPDQALFFALKAAGVETPSDTQSKDAITALIDGLTVDDRSLRYAALDLLVKRTAKTDLAADFKVLQSELAGGQMQLKEWEPPEGFPDQGRRDKLKEQQKQRAQAWRSWWRSNEARATLVDGVWVTK